MTEWLPECQTDAQREGWDIFEASGSMLNENGDRPFQLQALDESDKFVGDERDSKAWDHVYNLAHVGSLLHQQALNFLKEHSLPEFEAIIHDCSPDGRELNEEFQWPMI
ncbi:hypothetical protein [Mesorhizobium sp. M7A.F.Ca.MR.362.00.0.0]|uniref:hypothetical protein n=1 Tax=Mesorhizobium sp. M7A.F.Ca.MR.362.00.0.0 TaxID=2496779 RepID=UPI000FD25A20|nr:hypothetical protein [Mesorhizobium sp. M7A.F.Ca.MR.362.00.0.0]RUU78224.1 hypothetical protein EOC06_20630 [Mesorhizobium sp. M7A.F.Ca.MR.362.00.0.0]RWN95414.1 MAG: hypothetical protein EOS05_11515 [Mesorhizobium sp.]